MKKRTERVIPVKIGSSEREVQRGKVRSALTEGVGCILLIQARLSLCTHPNPPPASHWGAEEVGGK